ncbi:hypothetical protein KA012_04475 [Candidatus Woesebacteria bacterium]|nr:hypothetical protein [Candidatus Woesebacteria bacterium]
MTTPENHLNIQRINEILEFLYEPTAAVVAIDEKLDLTEIAHNRLKARIADVFSANNESTPLSQRSTSFKELCNIRDVISARLQAFAKYIAEAPFSDV